MTHTKPCKFCGIPVTVQSDPECPPEWAESLLKLLACNRCADYRAMMSKLGSAIRTVCLNYVQLVNSKTDDAEKTSKVRKSLEAMTWKVAKATCDFYRTGNTIYSQDFVDQMMEHPDKSTLILKTYATMVRNEARQQRQQHEQRINPETVLHGDSGEAEHKAQLSLQPDGQEAVALAAPETNQPAGGAGADHRGGVSQETLLI